MQLVVVEVTGVESPGEGATTLGVPEGEVRDYQEFRARGRFSSLADEPFAEDDGELGFGLEPFARRPFPFVSRVVQNQV